MRPIHILYAVTLPTLPLGLLPARRHRVRAQGITMLALVTGMPVIAAAFAQLASRITGRAVFRG